MKEQSQYRYCRCGTRLARYNTGDLCSACQNKARNERLEAPNVPSEFWLTERFRTAFANRHMGEIIYAYRTHSFHPRPISQEVVAGWAGISQAQLSRIESGPPLQDLKRLMHWAHTLRIPARLLWFQPAESSSDDGETHPSGTSEVSNTLRRDFVALGSSVVLAHALGALESELDLIHMTLDRGTTSDDRVEYLEGVADELGIQAVRAAPLAVLRPTLATLHSIRGLLEERQRTRHQRRLVAAGAKLSTVLGEVMFNMGQFKRARGWYKTAQHAASDAGDGYLVDISLAGQAYLPTYSDDPAEVLRLLSPRLDRNPPASPAIAWLWGFKARAHAALGEPEEFKHAIDNAQASLERSQPDRIAPGIFSFVPEKLAFYEMTGAVQLNDTKAALEAARRALTLYDPSETTEPALVMLDRASALAQAGEVAEACRVASNAITNPHTYYGITVHSYAHRFSDRIRTIQSAETREWRDVLAQVEKDKRDASKRQEREE